MSGLLNSRLLILVFVSYLVSNFSFGQTKHSEDSIFVRGLIGRAMKTQNPETQLKIIDSVISYSIAKRYDKGLAYGYKHKASQYVGMQQRDKAILFIDKAIAVSRKNNEIYDLMDELIFASALNNEYAYYTKAFAQATEALEWANKVKNPRFLGKSYLQLGRCYFGKGEYPNAIVYYQKAIPQFRKTTYIHEYRSALTALGAAYINTKAYEKALGQLLEVEKSNPEVPMDPNRLPELYGNIALCYDEMNEPGKAIAYNQKALDVTAKMGQQMLFADLAIKDNIGGLYLKIGKYDLAEKYLNEALAEIKLVGVVEYYKSIYGHLSELAFAKKQYKQAYEYQENYILYSDSLMNEEKMKALENLSVQFKTKEVANENKLLQRKNALQRAYAEQEKSRQNNWLIGLSAALLLILLAGYFYYRNSKQKQAIAVLEKNQFKQKLLIAQMNPHFIFNSIQNIRGLIFNQQNNEAVNYLDQFAKLTRQILENSNENYISLAEEVEMTENYLSIQQLLHNNKFEFAIEVDEAIDTESVFLPPMLTQPFIENAIKHGLSGRSGDGRIAIRFYLKDKQLFFEVSDNGKGFGAGKKTDNHKSMAMAITKERLAHYTRNNDFVVQTENLGAGENVAGAKVTFEIPYLYEN